MKYNMTVKTQTALLINGEQKTEYLDGSIYINDLEIFDFGAYVYYRVRRETSYGRYVFDLYCYNKEKETNILLLSHKQDLGGCVRITSDGDTVNTKKTRDVDFVRKVGEKVYVFFKGEIIRKYTLLEKNIRYFDIYYVDGELYYTSFLNELAYCLYKINKETFEQEEIIKSNIDFSLLDCKTTKDINKLKMKMLLEGSLL